MVKLNGLPENVVANDAERDHRDDIRQRRERCQIFQITNLQYIEREEILYNKNLK